MQKTGKTILSHFLLSALFMTTNKATSSFKRTRSAPPILHRKEVIIKLSDMLKNGFVTLENPLAKSPKGSSFCDFDIYDIYIDTNSPENFSWPSFFSSFQPASFKKNRHVTMKKNTQAIPQAIKIKNAQVNLRPDPLPQQHKFSDKKKLLLNLRPDPFRNLKLRPNPFPQSIS